MPLNEPQTRFITLSNGKTSVVLMCPHDHKLDAYLNTYPLYDRRLPILARIVSENYPDSTFLDIGANIGDTIALLRLGGCELHIIGIEPSRMFFSLLKNNIEKNKSFFGKTTIHHAFIGKPGEILHLVEANGTAHITKSAETDELADAVEVFDLHKFENETISIIKIDTDGYDSYIVNENKGFFENNTPILWVEAECREAADLFSWSEALDFLGAVYEFIVIFDNYGFVIDYGDIKRLSITAKSIIAYSLRQKVLFSSGYGDPRVHYPDFCLIPKHMERVYQAFLKNLGECNIP